MKEKIVPIINKVKELLEKGKAACGKLKEKLRKVEVFRKLWILAKRYRMYLSLGFFVAVMLALILIPVLLWQEFVVPVCIVLILAVLMAVFLHKSELWIHGICLLGLFIAGFALNRMPIMILCVIAYVSTTVALQFGFRTES